MNTYTLKRCTLNSLKQINDKQSIDQVHAHFRELEKKGYIINFNLLTAYAGDYSEMIKAVPEQ